MIAHQGFIVQNAQWRRSDVKQEHTLLSTRPNRQVQDYQGKTVYCVLPEDIAQMLLLSPFHVEMGGIPQRAPKSVRFAILDIFVTVRLLVS
jgi:hypothetical protein